MHAKKIYPKNNNHKYTLNSYQKVSLSIVIVLRIAAAIGILFHPLIGFIISTIFDYLDSVLLMHVSGMKRNQYTHWDKILDWVGYIIMIFVALSYPYAWILGVLLIYRGIGQVMYMYTQEKRYFIFFPNTFEFLWVYIVCGFELKLFTDLDLINLVFMTMVLTALKLFQEWFLHDYWPNRVKTHGYPSYMKQMGLNAKVYSG